MDSQRMDIETLRTSKDPDALREAAVRLASAPSAQGLRALGSSLGSAGFLSRLDSDEDYQSPPRTLRLAPVLEELGRSTDAAAGNVLVSLTSNATFKARISRVELLIKACARVRPPPPQVVAFWKEHCAAGDATSPLVVDAVLENDCPAALGIFEAQLASSDRDGSEKLFWLRQYVVPRRDNPGFLDAAIRLESGLSDDELRTELIRVTFDYDRGWFPPEASIRPPEPALITPAAKTKLQELGKRILASRREIPEPLKAAVKARLEAR